MRKILFSLLVLAVCGTHEARAQWAVIDPSNLAQNVLTVGKTGTTAANVINSFQEMQKIYSQGKEYYDKLKSVHNLIKDARKVKETVEMVSEISQIYADNFNRMLSDNNFSANELSAISAGYAILLKESGNLLSDIKELVSSSNGLSMTDAERMGLIDQIYTKMVSYRNLVSYYSQKNIAVSFIRSKEKGDTERVRALYGSPSERYW
ncbi:DUF4141 domain-containing protein [Phocaeicola sp.]